MWESLVRGCVVVVAGVVFGCGDEAPAEPSCPSGEPTLEGDGSSMTSVVIGDANTCALADDGTPYCWGDGSAFEPRAVMGVSRVEGLNAGPVRTCAIRPGGSAVCWSRFEPKPSSVPGLCGASALVLSRETNCALVAGGVRCWGGLNQTVFGVDSSERPVAVPGVTSATAVAAGRSGYTCALIDDGSVTCWGGGPRLDDRPGLLPEPVREIAGAVAIAGSDRDVCAVLTDGEMVCWSYEAAPTTAASFDGVVSFANARSHRCAALEDGTVRCWGQNQTGQLGNGTNEASEVPVVVEGISNAIAVAVGSLDSSIGHSCALLDDGTVRCWGSNTSGRLGDGAFVDATTPVEVSFP
jgi:alpha-tubulin suppressor-like RCC1 family protein